MFRIQALSGHGHGDTRFVAVWPRFDEVAHA